MAEAGLEKTAPDRQQEVSRRRPQEPINDKALARCSAHGHEGRRKWRWWEDKGGTGDGAKISDHVTRRQP